jgi:hypothetical protein
VCTFACPICPALVCSEMALGRGAAARGDEWGGLTGCARVVARAALARRLLHLLDAANDHEFRQTVTEAMQVWARACVCVRACRQAGPAGQRPAAAAPRLFMRRTEIPLAEIPLRFYSLHLHRPGRRRCRCPPASWYAAAASHHHRMITMPHVGAGGRRPDQHGGQVGVGGGVGARRGSGQPARPAPPGRRRRRRKNVTIRTEPVVQCLRFPYVSSAQCGQWRSAAEWSAGGVGAQARMAAGFDHRGLSLPGASAVGGGGGGGHCSDLGPAVLPAPPHRVSSR